MKFTELCDIIFNVSINENLVSELSYADYDVAEVEKLLLIKSMFYVKKVNIIFNGNRRKIEIFYHSSLRFPSQTLLKHLTYFN